MTGDHAGGSSRSSATNHAFPPTGDPPDLVRDGLRTPEDFTRVARELCADEAAQGTRYAEVTFTAASHGDRPGRPEMPLEAVLAGLAEGRAAYGVECRGLLDHSRRRPVERARRTLRPATRYAGDGVAGIGLPGEESYPLEPFAAVFDAVLVAELAERRIPLEVCPSSNVTHGLAPSLAELARAGVDASFAPPGGRAPGRTTRSTRGSCHRRNARPDLRRCPP